MNRQLHFIAVKISDLAFWLAIILSMAAITWLSAIADAEDLAASFDLPPEAVGDGFAVTEEPAELIEFGVNAEPVSKPSEVPPDVTRLSSPLIRVYVSPTHCPACERFKADMRPALEAGEFAFALTTAQPPAWVSAYPTLTWHDAAGKLWYADGWRGLDDFRRRYERTLTPNQWAAFSDTYKGQSWSHPGDARSHLIREHGFTESELRGLTPAQLERLHNAAHNGHARPAKKK